MDRLQIIQSLINKINAKSYLEIGVQGGYVFNNIQCETKIGVDPDINSKATVFKTSDDFFQNNSLKFDCIFIDGLHHSEQVFRDITNSLKCLNPYGYIICHDMNPITEIMQAVPMQTGIWTGDCWKAWTMIRSCCSDLHMFVVDTDYGCGIISYGQQKPILLTQELNWDNFVKNRQYWLNLISIQQFQNLL